MGMAKLLLLPTIIGAPSSFSSSKRSLSILTQLGFWRGSSSSRPQRSFATMMNEDVVEIFAKKRALRSRIRKQLRNMDPVLRAQEDNAIQNIVLEAPWFKSASSLCAYVSCQSLQEVDTSKKFSELLASDVKDMNRRRLYLPHVEDRNSNMRMLQILSYNDLTLSSMNILEPSLEGPDGKQREDLMQADEPVDLFILPGLAFDRCGRRLGRSGGYYDMYLKKYLEVVKERSWKPPLLVALSYSTQIVEEGAIAVTPLDIPVHAIACPDGIIPTRMDCLKI